MADTLTNNLGKLIPDTPSKGLCWFAIVLLTGYFVLAATRITQLDSKQGFLPVILFLIGLWLWALDYHNIQWMQQGPGHRGNAVLGVESISTWIYAILVIAAVIYWATL